MAGGDVLPIQRPMRRLSLFIFPLLAGGACAPKPPVSPPPPADNELLVAAPATVPTAPPADVFRALLIAMMNNDRAGVEAVILPHPDAAVLWDAKPLTPAERQRVIGSLRWGVTLYEIKPGSIIDLPGGYRLTVTADMVTDARRMYWPVVGFEKMPTPFWFHRAPGEAWKVDASPLIAGRKKAKEVAATQPAPD